MSALFILILLRVLCINKMTRVGHRHDGVLHGFVFPFIWLKLLLHQLFNIARDQSSQQFFFFYCCQQLEVKMGFGSIRERRREGSDGEAKGIMVILSDAHYCLIKWRLIWG